MKSYVADSLELSSVQQQESFEQYQTMLLTLKKGGGGVVKRKKRSAFFRLVEWRQKEKDRAVDEGVDD